jgi:hypothetical protein
MLIEKLKPVLGLDPEDEAIGPEEAKQRALEELDAQKKQRALMGQIEQEALMTKLQEAKLKNIELEAKIKKLTADTVKVEVDTEIAADQHEIDKEVTVVDSYGKGIDMAQKIAGGNGQDKKEPKRLNA